mgnify:CR=1 FL=1
MKKDGLLEVKRNYFHLNEELFNLEILPKVHKIVTTEIVLCVSQEHKPLFETPKFWKDQKSFLQVVTLEYLCHSYLEKY